MKNNLTCPQLPFARGRRRPGKLAAAGLLMVLWGLLLVFTANPAFHKWLHHDANQADHQCAIRLLEKQQVLSCDSTARLVVSEPGLSYEIVFDYRSNTARADIRLSDGRAPPFA